MKPVFLISLVLVSGSSAFWYRPRDSLVECKNKGLVCSEDCKTVEYCPEAQGPSSTIRTCESNTFCSDQSGIPECDAKSCPNVKPNCPKAGAIPSTSDCHKYFLCTKIGDENPTERSCGDQVFNPATYGCDADLACRAPVECAAAGDNGFVDPDTKLYCYYCTEVNTPYMYPC